MSSTAREVFDALTSGTGLLQPKWLYDDTGSQLYEAITELPEYYPTRVELGILRDHAPDIARLTAATHIAELGSGASPKTITMIRGFISHGLLESFTAFDVNADAAERSVASFRTWNSLPSMGISMMASHAFRPGGPGCWHFWAARSATSCPISAAGSSQSCTTASAPATGSSSASTS